MIRKGTEILATTLGRKIPLTTSQHLSFPCVFINFILYMDNSKILYLLLCWEKKKNKPKKQPKTNLFLALLPSLSHLPKSDTLVDEKEFTLLDKLVNLRLSSAVV